MTATAARLPRPADSVVCRPVADGAVLLSLEDETYFGLNAAGRIVWEALSVADATLNSAVDDLTARFPGVAAETLRADACDLLAELSAHRLVLPV